MNTILIERELVTRNKHVISCIKYVIYTLKTRIYIILRKHEHILYLEIWNFTITQEYTN